MTDVALIRADARRIPLRDSSVQAVVTSPPYWGLRKYAGAQDLIWANGHYTEGIVRCNRGDHVWNDSRRAGISGGLNGQKADYEENRFVPATISGMCELCGAWRGGFGLEPTIEMYVQHTVEILREIRRVLRPDGVVFWNIGDSYAAAKGYSGELKPSDLQATNKGSLRGDSVRPPNRNGMSGLKPKDLCLIPARVAIAAQSDGWWVRSLIIWAKPNPMPESVTDRPTDAYEHIIMLTKSERYFWDADAVREPAVAGWNGSSFTDARDQEIYKNLGAGPRNEFGYTPKGTHSRGNGDGGPKAKTRGSYENWTDGTREVLGSRNMRNVWMFATQPYKGAHFATFPEEIPRRCILAATSGKGCCPDCSAPWIRKIIHTKADVLSPGSNYGHGAGRNDGGRSMLVGAKNETIGWKPGCTCFPNDPAATRTCLVLDPFGGSGTTARVAVELNRRAVSLDLAYHDHAEKRTRNVQRKLGMSV